jgi:hypothetical protein
VTLKATDQNREQYELPLAKGDRVRLFNRVWTTGKGAGEFARNGSILEVQGVERDGIVLRNKEGRCGKVLWSKLQDPVNGRVRINSMARRLPLIQPSPPPSMSTY